MTLPDPQPASTTLSRTSNKGACNFQWGPGCLGATSPDGSHLCQLGRGHDNPNFQCECFYCGLKQINASRARV
jgi:hypothetical protein